MPNGSSDGTPGIAGADGRYTLLGADRKPYRSATPGVLGGHRGSKIYGRLDCRTALAAIERGGYVKSRVFFADRATAQAAGFRPCARCLPDEYREWKSALSVARPAR